MNLKVLDSNSETMEWDLRNGGKLLLLCSQRHAKTLTKPKGVFLPHGQFWMIGRFFCFSKLLFWIICTLANLVEGGDDRWPVEEPFTSLSSSQPFLSCYWRHLVINQRGNRIRIEDMFIRTPRRGNSKKNLVIRRPGIFLTRNTENKNNPFSLL